MHATSPNPVTTTALPSIGERLAAELDAKPVQVAAAVALLDEGATVPFIARYRKEATGGLDDVQLRRLEERLGYLRELEERRAAILESVRSQGKLTPELEAGLQAAETKQRLEDLYAPYKPKRRSKAQVAIEAGLDALADALLADPQLDPELEAAKYLRAAFETESGSNPGVPDTRAALDGARQILIERFAEDAELVGALRAHLEEHGLVVSAVAEGKEDAGAKFRDYFAYSEPYAKVAPHRALALFRGRNEDVLRVSLRLPEDVAAGDALVKPMNACERRIAAVKGIADQGRKADAWLVQTARWTWTVKLAWQLEMELFAALRERA
ncbi:MAG: RNA-binding transcriptional accessory protein, partial [Gammaproteobacteria bacterium]|nr:RNA-binding transcriptional accessory protein [Gammaproteobacteria bacterium]